MMWILWIGGCVISGMLGFVICAVLVAGSRADEAAERAMKNAKK